MRFAMPLANWWLNMWLQKGTEMDDLRELRYPWLNAVQFLTGGYPAEIGALHLVIGWLFVLVLVTRVLSERQLPFEFRCATLYFALTLFTNPAFNFVGLNLNEVFGVIGVTKMIARGRIPSPYNSGTVVVGLYGLFAVSMVHVLITLLVYPALNSDLGSAFTKIAINIKIAVLALNLAIVGVSLRRGQGLELLLRSCVNVATAGLLLYLLQVFIMAAGTMPYGTYLDAGFVGVPSFGSVSIERGHFGKFMAPYFPFMLFALLKWRCRWQFGLMCLITMINFSASSQVFFLCFCVMALLRFRRHMGLRAVMLIGVACVGAAALIVSYWDVFAGIGEKIYALAIEGDESEGGGRSFGVFYDYISSYPLGLGYSGSTLRTAPGLPEINASYFAFFAQFSFLAPGVLAAYLYAVWRAIRRARLGHGDLFGCLSLGVAMSVVIFFTDILWFVPLIWLPFELIHSLRRHERSQRETQTATTDLQNSSRLGAGT